MRINPLYAAVAAGVAILAVILILNNKINSSLVAEVQNNMAISEESLLPKSENSEKRTGLIEPLRAQQPGIYIQGEEKDSWSDEHWEAYVSKTLANSQDLLGEESQKMFDLIQKSPADFKQRLDNLNKRIEYYEGLKKADPNDAEVKKKLENLYVLKSTLLALEQKIVVSPSAGQ